MNPTDSDVGHLKGAEIFSGLSDADLAELAAKMKRKVFPPNTVIVREGAPGDAMFIIREGRVDVRRKELSFGMDLTITSLGDGACFGEMALLTGRPRTATVTAVQSTEVYVLERKAFETLLRSNPAISTSLNKVLADRVEEMNLNWGLGVVSLLKLNIDRQLLSLIPEQFLTRYKVLPVALSAGTLTLAMVNPGNLLAFDEIRKFVRGLAIEPVVITEDDFKAFMKNVYAKVVDSHGEEARIAAKEKYLEAVEPSMIDVLRDVDLTQGRDDVTAVTDLEKEAAGAPIVRLGNHIIAMALKKGASDIHLEPTEKGLRVRYRVDGLLREEQILPKKVQLPLISRFKIISGLDITERRVPQDGRITARLDGRPVDFRVSTVPAKYGEKIVTRILRRESTFLGLDSLVTYAPTLKLMRDMVRRPHGIIYVTGPTGSGKTTTLYSMLSELNKEDVNISTVEDPIEYDLAGINQVQVNHDIGLDFARVLRAFLRQDPDVILVGETRDRETAKISVEAALTGHLVFTTLHTNDAPSTFVRLMEMDIEPFLISTSVIGIIAQRLLRRVCPQCREPYEPDSVVADYLGLGKGAVVYRGRGCEACHLTGYRGRVASYEVLQVNEEIRHLIAQARTAQEIRKKAIVNGMKSLNEYCLMLLQEGHTSADEVLRVVAVET